MTTFLERLAEAPSVARIRAPFAATCLLGDELAGLQFYFATIGKDYDKSSEVRIEFHGLSWTIGSSGSM